MILIRPSSTFSPLVFQSPLLDSVLLGSTIASENKDNNDKSQEATNEGDSKQVKQVVDIRQPSIETTKVGEGHYAVSYDLPGVKSENIALKLEGNELHLSAERKQSDKRIVHFKRTLHLDQKLVDVSKIEQATLNDGVLTVIVPARKVPEPTKIQVSTTEPPSQNDKDAMDQWSLDLPGVKAADLTVKVADDKLTIEAERKRQDQSFHYFRTFTLDHKRYDLAKMEAFLFDGVLTLAMPKLATEETRVVSKSIAVASSAPVSGTGQVSEGVEDGTVPVNDTETN